MSKFSTCHKWEYYFRAVGKQRTTIDFLLTTTRDTQAALRFLKKAIGQNGKASLVNIDQNDAYNAGLKQLKRDQNTRISIRQCKYLNNTIEQDHRRINRLTRLILGLKTFTRPNRR